MFDRPSDQFPWLAAGEMLRYMSACCLWQAHMDTQIHLSPKFSWAPCSSLCLSSGSCLRQHRQPASCKTLCAVTLRIKLNTY